MRVAFVGKGGSGKTTLSTLFFINLIEKNLKTIIFDADLNIHVPKLLGINFPQDKSISLPDNIKKIRQYLIGKSKKIKSVNHFYKTTPPSIGVNLFTIDQENPIIKEFAIPYKIGYVSVVGTYEKNEIGRSCYHVNLSILENLLTFTKLKKDEWIIADMVAGIDAFSNTLHKQFDVIFLVIEPSQESIDVYNQYLELAKHANIDNQLFVIGNKVEDEDDEKFISLKIRPDKYLGSFEKNQKIKKIRQNNSPLTINILKKVELIFLEKLIQLSIKMKKDPNQRLKELHQLHLKYINQSYVKNAVGDLSYQIDENFKF